MGKYIIAALLALTALSLKAQDTNDTHAKFYKLDYNVPESPAFSILDANPVTVSRGSAAKEFALTMSNAFLPNQKVPTGIAADFNPFFVFGGGVKSIDQYRENYLLRVLANTQISLATASDASHPNDVLLASGIRITLIDSKDPVMNKKLGDCIDNILMPPSDDRSDPFDQTMDVIVESQELGQCYTNLKADLSKRSGGALSIGYALSGRLMNSVANLDSLLGHRSQFWLAGQYTMPLGLDLMGLAMIRHNLMEQEEDITEKILGLGLRYQIGRVWLGSEFVYSSEKSRLEVAINLEVPLLKNVLFYASIGNREELATDDQAIRFKPGFRYNFSEPKTE